MTNQNGLTTEQQIARNIKLRKDAGLRAAQAMLAGDAKKEERYNAWAEKLTKRIEEDRRKLWKR